MLERMPELAKFDCATKRRFFYRGSESCLRPEVSRYHKMISRIELSDEILVAAGGPIPSRFTEVIEFKPPFGPLPYELAETFPAGFAEVPTWDEVMMEYGIKGLKGLLETNPQTKVTISTTEQWADTFRKAFPEAEIFT